MTPSRKTLDLIEGFEVGSRAEYIPRPTWPGGASGLTIAIGYDLGYQSVKQVNLDWGLLLPMRTVTRLCSYVGRQGASAQVGVAALADIQIPFDLAVQVFENRDVPRYMQMTCDAFPNMDELPPDAQGALLSLVFNRGPGMTDPAKYPGSRLEMRQIRDAMSARQFDLIPGYLRSMKRLWSNGLVARREAEARLFEGAFASASQAAPAAPHPTPSPAPVPRAPLTADDLMAMEQGGVDVSIPLPSQA